EDNQREHCRGEASAERVRKRVGKGGLEDRRECLGATKERRDTCDQAARVVHRHPYRAGDEHYSEEKEHLHPTSKLPESLYMVVQVEAAEYRREQAQAGSRVG